MRRAPREERIRRMQVCVRADRVVSLELVEQDGAVVAEGVDVLGRERQSALEVLLRCGAVVKLGVDEHAVAGKAVDMVGRDL